MSFTRWETNSLFHAKRNIDFFAICHFHWVFYSFFGLKRVAVSERLVPFVSVITSIQRWYSISYLLHSTSHSLILSIPSNRSIARFIRFVHSHTHSLTFTSIIIIRNNLWTKLKVVRENSLFLLLSLSLYLSCSVVCSARMMKHASWENVFRV